MQEESDASSIRCRAGDLAVIIKDEPGLECNVGRIVHVISLASTCPVTGTCWYIAPASAAPYPYVSRRGHIVFGHPPPPSINHPDRWMVPIRPPQSLASVDDREPIQAPLAT